MWPVARSCLATVDLCKVYLRPDSMQYGKRYFLVSISIITKCLGVVSKCRPLVSLIFVFTLHSVNFHLILARLVLNKSFYVLYVLSLPRGDRDN